MKNKCLNPALIQAFLDGELSVLEMEYAASHLASCASCGEMARELEAEIFAVGQALEPELTLTVPTARLRARVEAAIGELPASANGRHAGHAASLLDRVRAWVISLTPQAAFGFAGALALLVLCSLIAVAFLRSNNSGGMVAAVDGPGGIVLRFPVVVPSAKPTEVQTISYRKTAKRGPLTPRPGPDSTVPLAAEKPYLDTIAQMDHSLSTRDDLDMRPTLRADIERNLAVLDQAVVTSQEQARLHPKDRNAAAFLNAAYQNKIEFLRTVSDQAQLYAALR